MTQIELLEWRIDKVQMVLQRPMSEWAKNYWNTVLCALVRQLPREKLN